MAKDVNIHIKATGAQQTKQQLDQAAQGAQKVGDSTEKMGAKSRKASGLLTGALKKLKTMGFLAIAAAIAAAAGKVAKFFDTIKEKSDEAARQLAGVRGGFDAIYEALSAFDEKSRQIATRDVAGLLRTTGVYKEIGLPVINEYIRQFRGKMPEAAYQQGLEGMLGYAARHGGAETKDLIQMMAGWGMVTGEQQGEFRRMISSAAAASGLTDADVIQALSRGLPTIKAMGWTPQQAVESIAVLAAGEAGRKKMSMPATTIQYLGQPQVGDLAKFGIPEELAEDPQRLYTYIQSLSATMGQTDFYRLLTKVYGTEGAAGVSKLITAQRGGIQAAMAQAVGARGVRAEAAEEQARRGTLEARDAATKAAVMLQQLAVTTKEQYAEDIRELGAEYQKVLQRRQPIRQWLREVILFKQMEKENAAYLLWLSTLPEEEQAQRSAQWERWRTMPVEEKYRALVGGSQRAPMTDIHYHNDQNFYPRTGEPAAGPRSAPEDIY